VSKKIKGTPATPYIAKGQGYKREVERESVSYISGGGLQEAPLGVHRGIRSLPLSPFCYCHGERHVGSYVDNCAHAGIGRIGPL
jgi:hypothetical protein